MTSRRQAVATALAILALANRFNNLEYLTFARQPITEPERAAFDPPISMAQGPEPEEEPVDSTPPSPVPEPADAKVAMPPPDPEGEVKEAIFTALATLEELPRIREWLRTVLGEGEVSREASADLALAVTEVCTNRIEHEHRTRSLGEFRFELTKQGFVIRVAIVDQAPPFQPGEIRPPAPEALAGGGYGLFLVDSTMDDVSFEAEGDISRVVLTKFDSPGEEES